MEQQQKRQYPQPNPNYDLLCEFLIPAAPLVSPTTPRTQKTNDSNTMYTHHNVYSDESRSRALDFYHQKQ